MKFVLKASVETANIYTECIMNNKFQRLSSCNMLDAKRDIHMSHTHIYYHWNMLQNQMNV